MARKELKVKARLMTHEVKAYVDATVYLQATVRNAIRFLNPDEFPTMPENVRRSLLAQLTEAMEPFEDESDA